MAFHDVLFPADYSRGAVGGPEFRTTITASGSGYESRNVDWQSARCRYDLSRVLYDRQTRDDALSFFRARRGKAHSFRFKDWNDYFVGMTWNPSTKVLDYATPQQFATGDGSTLAFQLKKTYTSGGFTEVRDITKPLSPTVRIYVGGVLQTTGFSVNYSTGVVTFSSAPANAAVIAWAGEFHVHARFDEDFFPAEYSAPEAGQVSLAIIEVRG